MILLDTSVLIELIEEGKAYELCLEQLIAYEPRHVHISAISMFEVEAGLFPGSPNIRRRRDSWQRIKDLVTYELVNDGVAIEAARIVRETSAAGRKLGNLDALIAGTAIEWNLTLCTRDRDFERVSGLKLELWR